MVDLVKWCLFITYFTGRLSGVLNFEVDFKTGQIKVTKRATVCAACSHFAIIFLLTHFLINAQAVVKIWNIPNSLQEYVVMVLAGLRLISVFLALVSRWSKRRTFMQLSNSIRRQFSPKITPYIQSIVISKFCSGVMAEAIQVIISLYTMHNQQNISVTLGIWGYFCLSPLLNVIIMQYFIAISIIRGCYNLLNEELQAIVAEAQSLNSKKTKVFVKTCCRLADRLEKIAHSQFELQALTERLSRTYQVQVVCLIITYYSNLVGSSYFTFSNFKSEGLPESFHIFVIVIYTVLNVSYLVDYWINAFNIFGLLNAHEEMAQLLSEHTSFQRGLDKRLQAVVSVNKMVFHFYAYKQFCRSKASP